MKRLAQMATLGRRNPTVLAWSIPTLAFATPSLGAT
jgi:hypothetical protein